MKMTENMVDTIKLVKKLIVYMVTTVYFFLLLRCRLLVGLIRMPT